MSEETDAGDAPMQALVDDDLIHQEKIGASNYFWYGRYCNSFQMTGSALCAE